MSFRGCGVRRSAQDASSRDVRPHFRLRAEFGAEMRFDSRETCHPKGAKGLSDHCLSRPRPPNVNHDQTADRRTCRGCARAFLSHRKGNVNRKGLRGRERGRTRTRSRLIRTCAQCTSSIWPPFILISHPRSNPNQQPKVDKFGGLSSSVPCYQLFMYCFRMQGEKMQAVCETLLGTRRSKP